MTKDEKMTVMIIDENPGIREFYGLELEDSGFEVVTVGDVAAVEQEINRSRPDLVIMDPWIGGHYRWDVLSDIKGGHSLMPVLLCLAFDRPFPFEAPFPQNLVPAEGFVRKTASASDLLLQVEQIMGAPRKCKVQTGGSI